MRNYGLHSRACFERRRTFNPELPPDAAFGDVGYVIPDPLPFSDGKMATWLHKIKLTLFVIAVLTLTVALIVLLSVLAHARDDGRYANSPLKPWFDQLASKKGLCCDFADGIKVENVDWDTQDGHYRVRICANAPTNAPRDRWIDCTIKDWIVVPDDALVAAPNRFGPAVVWPYAEYGKTKIRCFMPGAGA